MEILIQIHLLTHMYFINCPPGRTWKQCCQHRAGSTLSTQTLVSKHHTHWKKPGLHGKMRQWKYKVNHRQLFGLERKEVLTHNTAFQKDTGACLKGLYQPKSEIMWAWKINRFLHKEKKIPKIHSDKKEIKLNHYHWEY